MAIKRAVVEQLKNATVAIGSQIQDPNMRGPEGYPFQISGTGFSVDARGLIVTCAHVLEPYLKFPVNQVPLRFPPSGEADSVTASADQLWKDKPPEVVWYNWDQPGVMRTTVVPVETLILNPTRDIAILRIPLAPDFRNGYPTVELASYSDLHEGQDVGTCGFPHNENMVQSARSLSSCFSQGILSAVCPIPNAEEWAIENFHLDIRASYGNSGGPAFLADTGKVFGVVQSGVYGMAQDWDLVMEHGKHVLTDKQRLRILPGFTNAAPVFGLRHQIAMRAKQFFSQKPLVDLTVHA